MQISSDEDSQQNKKRKKKIRKDKFKLFTILNETESGKTIPEFERQARLEDITKRFEIFFGHPDMADSVKYFVGAHRFTFKKFLFDKVEKTSESIERLFDDFKYGLKDVEYFMNERFEQMQSQYDLNFRYGGAAISKLINKAAKNDRFYVNKNSYFSLSIQAELLPIDIDFWGYELEKNINLIINGNSGICSGFGLNGGRLDVVGDTGIRCGDCSTSGEIEVYGNTGDYLGTYNDGSRITVHGNAEKEIGDYMTNGRIDIFGNAEKVGLHYEKGIITIGKKLDNPLLSMNPNGKGKSIWKRSNIMNKYKKIYPSEMKYKRFDDI